MSRKINRRWHNRLQRIADLRDHPRISRCQYCAVAKTRLINHMCLNACLITGLSHLRRRSAARCWRHGNTTRIMATMVITHIPGLSPGWNDNSTAKHCGCKQFFDHCLFPFARNKRSIIAHLWSINHNSLRHKRCQSLNIHSHEGKIRKKKRDSFTLGDTKFFLQVRRTGGVKQPFFLAMNMFISGVGH